MYNLDHRTIHHPPDGSDNRIILHKIDNFRNRTRFFLRGIVCSRIRKINKSKFCRFPSFHLFRQSIPYYNDTAPQMMFMEQLIWLKVVNMLAISLDFSSQRLFVYSLSSSFFTRMLSQVVLFDIHLENVLENGSRNNHSFVPTICRFCFVG